MAARSPMLENCRMSRAAVARGLLLISCWTAAGAALAARPAVHNRYQQAGDDHGTLAGWVFNGSRELVTVPGAEVVLRAELRGQYDVVGATTTDAQGQFQFNNLPVDADIQYVPGANRGEVHYPGPRLRLTTENPHAQVKVVVYESNQGPSPLVLERHDIVLQPRASALEVRESMIIDNPSNMTFVGQPAHDEGQSGTLRLAIPANFERVTFEKEFYGRRFSLVEGKLLTEIPWPPGKRRLQFSYVLPRSRGPFRWQRTIDLPCSHLHLTVLTDQPAEVRCNLAAQRTVADHRVTYRTTDIPLRVGQKIQLQLGSEVRPLIDYGRWAALALLGVLIGGTGIGLYRTSKSPLGEYSKAHHSDA